MLLSILSIAAACKSKDGLPASATSSPHRFFDEVRFQNGLDDSESYTEPVFASAAERAFQRAVPEGVVIQKAAVTGILEPDGDQMQLSLALQLSVRGSSRPVETSLFAVAGLHRPAREVAEKGLSDLSRAGRDLLGLLVAPPDRLTAALSSAELDVQVLAARLIGERHLSDPKTAAALCRMLTDPRDEAAEAAAESLKAVGTPAIVPLIIRSVQRGNLRSEVRAIEVMGRIGGPEAEAYLEMTAMGHEIPEVRSLSRSLLKTMRETAAR